MISTRNVFVFLGLFTKDTSWYFSSTIWSVMVNAKCDMFQMLIHFVSANKINLYFLNHLGMYLPTETLGLFHQ
jgi:hypothetical protein